MNHRAGAHTRSPWRIPVRIVFIIYALVLVTLTHWPGLAIEEGDIPRPDLFVHFGAFGLWTLLCAACGWFGNTLGATNLFLSFLVAAAYAMLDEVSQAIPVLRRYAVLDDLLANWGGVLLAGLGLFTLRLVAAGTTRKLGQAL